MFHFKIHTKILLLFVAILINCNLCLASNILATVNTHPITDHDVRSKMQILKLMARNSTNFDSTLKSIIDDMVVIDFMEKNKVYISDKEVTEAIEQFAAQNGLTYAQLEATLKHDNVSMRSFKEYMRADLYKGQYVNGYILHNFTITKEEVEKAKPEIIREVQDLNKEIAKVKLSEIVVYGDDKTLAQLEGIKRDIEKELSEDKDKFYILAKRYSEGPTAANGGTLGWFNFEDLSSLYQSIISQLRKEAVSKPFINEHILVFIKLEDATYRTAKAVQNITDEQIEGILKNKKIEEKVTEHLEKLRQKTFINIKQ